jgi:hypothetical protein
LVAASLLMFKNMKKRLAKNFAPLKIMAKNVGAISLA